ncbi:hypothetical protein AusDCA_3085 [Desulfitobacterium sp. AusDCA]
MPLMIIFFASIPEEFLITILGLKLFGFRVRPFIKQILLIAVIQAFISYAVRRLPLPFGVHTLIQIPLFSVPLYLLLRIPYIYSFVAILISATIYTTFDAIFIPFLLQLTGIPLDLVLNSITLRLLFFIPQALSMLLLVIFVHFKGFKIFDLTN